MTRPAYDQLTEASGIPIADEAASMMVTRYQYAAELARGRRTLELGCATGPGLRMLSRTASSVIGTDVNFTMLQRAAAHFGAAIPVAQADSVALPFKDRSFDFVLMLEASYYVERFDLLLAEIARVLDSSGVVLFVNANPDRPDFIRSPFSYTYHSADGFREALTARGFQVETSAAFPLEAQGSGGLATSLIRVARTILETLHLVPRTLQGRARLKRLLGLRLRTMPAEIDGDFGQKGKIERVGPGVVTGHKVIYVVGRKLAMS